MRTEKVKGFEFNEILLEDARRAVIIGDGNYSDVKAFVLESLPKLNEANQGLPPGEQKTLSFGLPGGKEPTEDQRRGICMALTITCKHAGLPWRVTYSGTFKRFLFVPREFKRTYQPRKVVLPRQRSGGLKRLAPEIAELYKKGKSVREICAILKIAKSSAGRYVTEYRKSLGGK